MQKIQKTASNMQMMINNIIKNYIIKKINDSRLSQEGLKKMMNIKIRKNLKKLMRRKGPISLAPSLTQKVKTKKAHMSKKFKSLPRRMIQIVTTMMTTRAMMQEIYQSKCQRWFLCWSLRGWANTSQMSSAFPRIPASIIT